MRIGRFATQFGYSMIGVLVLMGGSPSRALAQDGHSHMQAPQINSRRRTESKAGALVKAVRKRPSAFRMWRRLRRRVMPFNSLRQRRRPWRDGTHFVNAPWWAAA